MEQGTRHAQAKMGELAKTRSVSFKLLAEPAAKPKYNLGVKKGQFPGFKGVAPAAPLVPSGFSDSISKQIAQFVGIDSMVRESLVRAVAPGINATILTGLNLPTAQDLLGPAVQAQMDAIVRMMETATRINWAARTHATTTTTPVRERPQVRRLLRRLHPALLRKLDGIYEALDGIDGTGQSAYSATELIKLLTFQLVSYADAARFARERYNEKHSKVRHLELISVRHGVDLTSMLMVTRQGALGDDFQDIKLTATRCPTTSRERS